MPKHLLEINLIDAHIKVHVDAFTTDSVKQNTGNINIKVDSNINKQNNPLLLNALNTNIKITTK